MNKIKKKKEKSKKLPEDTKEEEMSFLDHLETLRWHILRAGIAIIAFAIIIFTAKTFVFDVIIGGPLKEWFPTYGLFCKVAESMCFGPPNFQIIPKDITEQFIVHIKSSLVLGFIISFPYVFWEIWKFVKPGLYDKEKEYAKGVVFICSALFLTGVLFGYFIIAPFALNFLGNYSVGDFTTQASSLNSYVSSLTAFTLPTGVVFQLPVLVYFLSKIGLVTPEFMRKYRRHSIIVILIMSAIITPPDVITQFLIGIPVYGLYEISILISKRVQPKDDD